MTLTYIASHFEVLPFKMPLALWISVLNLSTSCAMASMKVSKFCFVEATELGSSLQVLTCSMSRWCLVKALYADFSTPALSSSAFSLESLIPSLRSLSHACPALSKVLMKLFGNVPSDSRAFSSALPYGQNNSKSHK